MRARTISRHFILSTALLVLCSWHTPTDRRAEPPGFGIGCWASVPTPLENAPLAPSAGFIVTANINYQWVVNGSVQPTLILVRCQSYLFDLTGVTDEHPFLINDQTNNPFGTIYLPGSYGSVVNFTPTAQMPGMIWYHCSVHSGMTGAIQLVNPCPGDLNNDLVVNSTDFGLFVADFGNPCGGCKSDINNDGTVNSTDFGLFVAAFGSTCG